MKPTRYCILSVAVVCLFGLRLSGADDTFAVQQDYARQMAAMQQMAPPPQAVNPTTEIVFPRVANGVLEGMRIITTIAITSTVAQSTTANIRFFSEAGGNMSVTTYNTQTGALINRGSEATVFIPGFETVFVETDGIGGVVVGWAAITASRPIGANGSFQFIIASNNQFLTAVGVGGSTASPPFFIPIFRDEALDSNTALALTNSSSQTAYLKLFLFENNGGQVTRTISIGPGQSFARFIQEIFSVGRRFLGTLHCIRVDSLGNADARLDIFPIALFTSKGILSSLPATNLIVF
jgi:hypothetical protein